MEESEILKKDKEKKEVEKPKYTPEEEDYSSLLLRKFESALTQREEEHPELDGMSYSQYHDSNEKIANTFIEPRQNEEDSNYQSGTARDKMFALLSSINNLNLSPDISAFDKDNLKVANLGEAMEDTILKTEELDGDDEKKHLRQLEMLKQGEVYVEEIWDERWMLDKKIQKGGVFSGQIKGLSWTSVLKKMFSKPSRKIISGLSMVLGDLREYDFTLQPYIFTIEIENYNITETKFGSWDRWEYVPKTFQAPTYGEGTYDKVWDRFDIESGKCVILRMQDPWNNEYAVMINNVLMTPVGLPLTHIHGYRGYNIAKQVLEPISAKFAIGNSLPRKLRTKVGLLDEMIRLQVLKTQQSYKPPMINTSGRYVSKKIFFPGVITHGADLAGKLVPLFENGTSGVTNSEMAMVEQIRKDIDSSSVSPTFQGQSSGDKQTATEIVELQRQAKLMLGLTNFACSLLEWKLAWLRLFNILAKWFDPYDTKIQKTRDGVEELKNVYRKSVVERPIEGEGTGIRMVVPTEEELPSPVEVKEAEDIMKEKTGTPTRLIFMKPETIKDSKLIWQIVIRPREKTTSEMSKLLFRAEIADVINTFGPKVNLDYYSQIFASVWGRDPNKIFNKSIPLQPNPSPESTATKVGGIPSVEKTSGLEKQVVKQ